ncbi:unnamed protein product [Brassicogethes aeneus]|uniref:rRNA methyltransferase 2, mitochondrial n=1 Tax=Brassicogethes aeneus TaxID=1431903 RepID=A0A9P0BJF6_BRAAE|nr:unnamed protein product [Brassicogethes aeneus]
MNLNKILYRTITTSKSASKKVTTNDLSSKKLKHSSQQWLSRQMSDPYVDKAKMLHYRCRSAFKLIEIDDKYKFLKPGDTVVDCGAAPGSWTQVAVNKVNADAADSKLKVGKVFSIDKQQIFPINGAAILGNMDFTQTASQEELRKALNGSKINAVISDMAPSATGIGQMDKENIIHLCYSVLRFAVLLSDIDAAVLVKLWQCGETKKLETDIGKFYRNVKIVKPNASRADSAEIFILGRNFKGLKVS